MASRGKARRPKSSDEIRRNMSAIRSTENRTELALRRLLHAGGLRYRKNVRSLPGRPDIVFPSARVVVFIDGDYWHGRILVEEGAAALRRHFTKPQQGYWVSKITRNAQRDAEVTEALIEEGWCVLRFWESDTKRNIRKVANMIRRRVLNRRRAFSSGRPSSRQTSRRL